MDKALGLCTWIWCKICIKKEKWGMECGKTAGMPGKEGRECVFESKTAKGQSGSDFSSGSVCGSFDAGGSDVGRQAVVEEEKD